MCIFCDENPNLSVDVQLSSFYFAVRARAVFCGQRQKAIRHPQARALTKPSHPTTRIYRPTSFFIVLNRIMSHLTQYAGSIVHPKQSHRSRATDPPASSAVKAPRSEQSPITGSLLLLLSAISFRASFYIWFEQGSGNNDIDVDTCITIDGVKLENEQSSEKSTQVFLSGFPISTLIPLSFILLLIFLMMRYVALRLYLRN